MNEKETNKNLTKNEVPKQDTSNEFVWKETVCSAEFGCIESDEEEQ